MWKMQNHRIWWKKPFKLSEFKSSEGSDPEKIQTLKNITNFYQGME